MGQLAITIYIENEIRYKHYFSAKNTPDFTGVKYLYITMPVFFSVKTKEGL